MEPSARAEAELRAHLMTIQLAAGLLERSGELTPDQQEYLREILAAVHRMADVIEGRRRGPTGNAGDPTG